MLIVDDEEQLLLTIQAGFETYKDQFEKGSRKNKFIF
jgi:hypothetical protein